MGDFFDATYGARIKASKAHVKLKPEAREAIKEKLGCTDEELDEALKKMGEEMTEIAHADADYLHERGQAKQKRDWSDLKAKRDRERADEPDPTG